MIMIIIKVMIIIIIIIMIVIIIMIKTAANHLLEALLNLEGARKVPHPA